MFLLDAKAEQRIRQHRHVGAAKLSTARSGGDKQPGGTARVKTDGDKTMSARLASRLVRARTLGAVVVGLVATGRFQTGAQPGTVELG
jgi:hypothetical protein